MRRKQKTYQKGETVMKKQEENIAAIAERIRGLRDIVGISAAEMAKALDISEQ